MGIKLPRLTCPLRMQVKEREKRKEYI